MQTLTGHVDAATAHVLLDYPYGFRLRCQQRHWIEFKPRHGFRHVTQTSNPKRPGTWNKPKADTYAPVLVLVLNGDGHVKTRGLGTYATEETIALFEDKHAHAFTEEHRGAIRYLRAIARASKHVTWTVTSVGYDNA